MGRGVCTYLQPPIVFPNLEEDIRNNRSFLACLWQKYMLSAINVIHSPRILYGQQPDSMDYISFYTGDETKDLNEGFATSALHTPIRRHDSM